MRDQVRAVRVLDPVDGEVEVPLVVDDAVSVEV